MQISYDCFISHAHEDKDSFVRNLAFKLKENGLRVWYDEFVLKLGDSLTKSINDGIDSSMCGIIVLSHNFFNKHWTFEELNALMSKKNQIGKNIILPILLNITHKEVFSYFPMLADIYSINADKGLDYVCDEIEKS